MLIKYKDNYLAGIEADRGFCECSKCVRYLVEGVLVGLVTDARVKLELSQGPHARPAVLLARGQEHGRHRVVELGN